MTECYEHFRIIISGTSTPINNAKVERAGLYHSISNEDGDAVVKGTKGQTYLVTVSHPNFKTRSANITWGCNPDTHWIFPLIPKDPTPQKCKQLFLVKDSKTLRPISGVKVSGQNKLDTTDSNGYAELEAGQNSKATVAFEKDGYQRRLITFIWICSHAHVVKMTPTAAPPPTECSQYFLVKDKYTGKAISLAKVSGAGKISFTNTSGSASLIASKNSTNYVSVGVEGYVSQTKLITWLCNYTQLFEMVPEGATPEKATTLKWDGSSPTSAGVDQEVIFKFKLAETSNSKSVYGESVELAVNGYYTNVKRFTNSHGKVSLPYKFKTTGTHKVYGLFEANFPYKGDASTEKEIKVTAPMSAYLVTAHDLPAGKTYIVKAFEGTSIYWDPAKAYQVTSLNKTCDILRSDMTTPGTGRTIKLFDENGNQVYKTSKPIRALKSTNDRLAVNVYANEGKEYRINMSNVPDTPAVNEAFNLEAKLIKGQTTPVGAGQSVIFSEEVAEGQYDEIGTKDTNDFGVAKYRHSGKSKEGSYNFIAKFEHGEASCDVHTVTVGREPSGFEDFLVPLFKWVQEMFNVDEETAKTYTYVGIGILGLVLLGGFLK